MRSVLSLVMFGSLVAAVGCVGMEEQTGTDNAELGKGAATAAPKLNLSHIQCTDDGKVLAHFVLLFYGASQPGSLSGTWNGGDFGPVDAYKSSGNVWHYEVLFPSGEVDILSATIAGTNIQLHNPEDYAGDYQCGPVVPACPIQVTPTDATCFKPGSEDTECGYFGLVPAGKDDGLTGLTFQATISAYVALVKSGVGNCSTPGESAYRVYTNVTAGDWLDTPDGQNISHVTYCACPQQ